MLNGLGGVDDAEVSIGGIEGFRGDDGEALLFDFRGEIWVDEIPDLTREYEEGHYSPVACHK